MVRRAGPRRRVAQEQHHQQYADDGEAEQHEPIGVGQHVGLGLDRMGEKRGRPRVGFGLADRTSGQRARRSRAAVRPSAANRLDVEPNEIRIDLLADSNEGLNEGGAEFRRRTGASSEAPRQK